MRRIAFLAAATMLTMACGGPAHNKADDTDDSSEQQGEATAAAILDSGNAASEAFTTSRAAYEYDEDKVQVKLLADMPSTGNPLLRNAVAEFVSERLGGTYEGSTSQDMDKLIDYYGKQITKSLNAMLNEELETADTASINGFYRSITISKAYETPLLVTFNYSDDEYYNGAHGNLTAYGVTFRKSDGRRFTTDMLRDIYSDDMYAAVKEGLRSYFAEFEEGKQAPSDSALQEYILTDDNIDYMPLPRHAPWVTAEGITFAYMPYEITGYAIGTPTFTLSIKEATPFLTVTAKRMLGL